MSSILAQTRPTTIFTISAADANVRAVASTKPESQMPKSSAADFANYRATTNRVELALILSGLIETVAVWIARRRQRRVLAALDQHLLEDVGLSREQARREAAKPFWKC
jgi:uncharacterized protein YjiS (DUF1127 family)